MASNEKFDTIVIGAGIAGLYAAYLLQQEHGKKVLLLEAKDRIGGRVFATEIKTAGGTEIWDLGGQWVGKTQHYVLDALTEFGLETFEQFSTGGKKLVLHDFSDIRSYSGLIPTLGPLELLEINSLIGRVTQMSDSIDVDDIASHPNALEWDSITLHSYMADNCTYETTRDMLELAIRTIFGVDLSQMSLLFFLYYCKQGGNFEALMDAKNGGAQEFRVKGSMYKLCEKIAERLSNILTGEPVESIDQSCRDIKVTTKTGKTFQCENVILAIPPHLVNHIDFSPKLPIDRIRLGELMTPGHLIKFIVTYKTAFWKNNGLSGEVIATTLPGGTGPLTCTFDGTSANGSPAIVGFICAEHAVYWTGKLMVERREAILQSLAATLGDEALNSIEYIDKDWAQEPYNGGCPTSVFRPRGLIYFHHALTQPFGRVYWAGTETAGAWCGYVDGAFESGIRAVSQIIDEKPKSPSAWKESPVFSHFKKYKSLVRDRKPSMMRRILKASVGIAVVGIVGYYVAEQFRNYYFSD